MGDNLAEVNLGTGFQVSEIMLGTYTSLVQGHWHYLEHFSIFKKPTRSLKCQYFVNVLGYEHTCASSLSGGIKCFGRGDKGQLGYGNAFAKGDGPNELGDNLEFVDLGVGFFVTNLTTSSPFAYRSCASNQNGRFVDYLCFFDEF